MTHILKLFDSLIAQLAQAFPIRLFWLQLNPNVHVPEFVHLRIEISAVSLSGGRRLPVPHKPTRLIWFQVKYSLNRFQIPVEAIGQRAHQLANREYGITAHTAFGIDPHFLVRIVQFVAARRSVRARGITGTKIRASEPAV
jgi:hypothetical protein